METLVVDLFAGAGGYTQGAQQCSNARAILAVDSDPKALAVITQNHPGVTVWCETLGEGRLKGMKNLAARILEKVESEWGSRPGQPLWHLHCSPPCHKLSASNCASTFSYAEATALTRWAIQFIQVVRPSTWSLEQVSTPVSRHLLDVRSISYRVYDMYEDLGLPQQRKRIIAAPEDILKNIRNVTGKKRTASDVIDLPPGTLLHTGSDNWPDTKNGGHRKVRADEANRDPVRSPSHTVTSKPFKLVKRIGSSYHFCGQTTPAQMAALQTFPARYFDNVPASRSRKYIGNAVPCDLGKAITQAATKCLKSCSPSPTAPTG